jgi:hypothetical protein
VILGIGLACAGLQLLVVLYAVSRDGGTAVDLVWLAIPAVLTAGWAYARRNDRLLPVNVLVAIGVVTAVQVLVYAAFQLGDTAVAVLPAVLLVAMVFLMAAWSGRGF